MNKSVFNKNIANTYCPPREEKIDDKNRRDDMHTHTHADHVGNENHMARYNNNLNNDNHVNNNNSSDSCNNFEALGGVQGEALGKEVLHGTIGVLPHACQGMVFVRVTLRETIFLK